MYRIIDAQGRPAGVAVYFTPESAQAALQSIRTRVLNGERPDLDPSGYRVTEVTSGRLDFRA